MMYLVRHGQTDWNAELRLQGQKDIPLNDTGRTQAARNGRELAKLIDAPDQFDFVASPLGRTRETMEIILAQFGLSKERYRRDVGVIEITFGDWEGYTFEELRVENNDAVEERLANKWNFVQPNGESYQMMCDRVAVWLKTVTRDTVVVCHGGTIRALMVLLTNMPTAQAAELSIPQDRIYQWDGRQGSWI
jgi:broad specificity phosphatase PhoE